MLNVSIVKFFVFVFYAFSSHYFPFLVNYNRKATILQVLLFGWLTATLTTTDGDVDLTVLSTTWSDDGRDVAVELTTPDDAEDTAAPYGWDGTLTYHLAPGWASTRGPTPDVPREVSGETWNWTEDLRPSRTGDSWCEERN